MGTGVGGTNGDPLAHTIDDERVARSGNLIGTWKTRNHDLRSGRSLSRWQNKWKSELGHHVTRGEHRLELREIFRSTKADNILLTIQSEDARLSEMVTA